MAQIPNAPLNGAATVNGSRAQTTVRSTTSRPRPRAGQAGGMPDWLIVMLVLAFVFVGVPMLMPILWAVYLLSH